VRGDEKSLDRAQKAAAAAIKAEPEFGRALGREHLQLQLPGRPASALGRLLPPASCQITLLTPTVLLA